MLLFTEQLRPVIDVLTPQKLKKFIYSNFPICIIFTIRYWNIHVVFCGHFLFLHLVSSLISICYNVKFSTFKPRTFFRNQRPATMLNYWLPCEVGDNIKVIDLTFLITSYLLSYNKLIHCTTHTHSNILFCHLPVN